MATASVTYLKSIARRVVSYFDNNNSPLYLFNITGFWFRLFSYDYFDVILCLVCVMLEGPLCYEVGNIFHWT